MILYLISGLVFLSSLFGSQTQTQINKTKTSEKHSIVSQVEAAPIKEPAPLGLQSEGIYVVDTATQQPVLSYNANQAWSIASLTKLMTALVYLDQKPNLNKVISFTATDYVGGATLKVPIGAKFRAIDLLHSSLMSSANNSTAALARSTELTTEEFVQKMNSKAQSLNLTQTHFVDPTGLDPANQSTPAEYAKIVALAFANPTIANIEATTQYQMMPLNYNSFPIGTTDKLLKTPQDFEVLGGKTGFTDGSDYNFVTQVKKDNKNLIVVVFGDPTFDGAFTSAQKLAEATLNNNQ